MKRSLFLILTGGLLCLAAGAFWINNQKASRLARAMAEQQAAWQQERADLLAALEQARSAPPTITIESPSPTAQVAPATTTRLSPAAILARLQSLQQPGNARMREAVYWLEELVHIGPDAVPAIGEFLASGKEVAYDLGILPNRPARDGRLPGDFLLPPTLRLGLFDVLRRIGGASAESVLAETLAKASLGVEVACLTRMLQELNANRYRETALGVAYALLEGASPDTGNALGRNHRDYLFAVLSFYGDTTFASHAQNQLLRPDNQIDRGALRYLEKALGAQAVPLVAQVYENPLLQTNAAAKEPLARLALNFVGADAQANEFYQKAINDPVLSRGDRKNLIEDLNEDGFADPRNLTSKDLALIQNRISLIERLAPSAMDQANAAAFREAYKDLVNMRAKVTPGSPPR
jgi:hypothetical protein